MNYLSCLVLGNLVLGVLLALLTLAVGASGLWDVDLGENVSLWSAGFSRSCISCSRCSQSSWLVGFGEGGNESLVKDP